MHSAYCCHADAGAHSGEFIYGLESFVYKDVKPGGYAWLLALSCVSIAFASVLVLLVESIR